MTSDLLAHLMHVVEVADRNHLIARADREILEAANNKTCKIYNRPTRGPSIVNIGGGLWAPSPKVSG